MRFILALIFLFGVFKGIAFQSNISANRIGELNQRTCIMQLSSDVTTFENGALKGQGKGIDSESSNLKNNLTFGIVGVLIIAWFFFTTKFCLDKTSLFVLQKESLKVLKQ